MSYFNNNSQNLAPQTPNRMNNFNFSNTFNPTQNNTNLTNTIPSVNMNQGNTNYLFPQSQGSVYFLNTAQEINNIPIANNGVSAALSLSEGILYLKAMQNGNIILNGYRLTALEHAPQEHINQEVEQVPCSENVQDFSSIEKLLKNIDERLKDVESQISKKEDNVVKW